MFFSVKGKDRTMDGCRGWTLSRLSKKICRFVHIIQYILRHLLKDSPRSYFQKNIGDGESTSYTKLSNYENADDNSNDGRRQQDYRLNYSLKKILHYGQNLFIQYDFSPLTRNTRTLFSSQFMQMYIT